ncbi:AEL_collapsed_G0018030.mRNA.1.CDS.1 [Saccharomyces cerevisiae]|nr:AEL_collapsed_G0018030.mRNA.1.CDS.1 [Saccharomyces cerevisiae]
MVTNLILAESIEADGDITPNDPMTKEEKHRREFRQRCKPVWKEDMSKILISMKCWFNVLSTNKSILIGNNDLKQFFDSYINDIKTDEVKKWTQSLLEDRQAFFDSLKE